jgi:hypothetical protein
LAGQVGRQFLDGLPPVGQGSLLAAPGGGEVADREDHRVRHPVAHDDAHPQQGVAAVVEGHRAELVGQPGHGRGDVPGAGLGAADPQLPGRVDPLDDTRRRLVDCRA